MSKTTFVLLLGGMLLLRPCLAARGNLGIEGGGVVLNLAAAAARQQTTQNKYGTVSTGSSGAMFSGTSLGTGKPTFWYAGM
jgi:hypothetical protein